MGIEARGFRGKLRRGSDRKWENRGKDTQEFILVSGVRRIHGIRCFKWVLSFDVWKGNGLPKEQSNSERRVALTESVLLNVTMTRIRAFPPVEVRVPTYTRIGINVIIGAALNLTGVSIYCVGIV